MAYILIQLILHIGKRWDLQELLFIHNLHSE